MVWADAICIHQTDAEEKAGQVSIMNYFYQCAARVHAFLGPEDNFSTLVLNNLDRLQSMLGQPQASTLIAYQNLEERGVPEPEDAVWNALRNILGRPWFRRVWIVQEAVLAGDDLCLHFGSRSCNWTDLLNAIKNIRDCGLARYIARSDSSLEPTGSHDYSGFIRVLEIETVKKADPVQLVHAMMLTRERQCSNPLDRIYAWKGLLPDSRSSWITVTYMPKVRENYWIAYLEASHVALSSYSDGVETLKMATTQTKLPGLPSWASNLESEFDCFALSQDSFRAGHDLHSDLPPYVGASRDGSRILLNGLLVSEVSKILTKSTIEVPDFPRRVGNWAPDSVALGIRWLRIALGFVAECGWTVGQCLRALTVDQLPIPQQSTNLEETILNYFTVFVAYLEFSVDNPGELLHMEHAKAKMFVDTATALRIANYGKRLFQTKCGRVGNGYYRIEPGDCICIFRKMSAPFILRPHDPPDGTFTYVGEAWVDGLMDEEAFTLGLEERQFWLR